MLSQLDPNCKIMAISTPLEGDNITYRKRGRKESGRGFFPQLVSGGGGGGGGGGYLLAFQ